MAEEWVRPVTGAREAGSEAVAVWRFRLLSLLVLALLAVGVVAGLSAVLGG